MNVTIITDASYCNQTTACGWGYSIVCDRGRFASGGSSKFSIGTSTEAELTGVVEAVVVAYERGLLHPGDYLILQTDCSAVIDIVQDRKTKKNKQTLHSKELGERLRALIASLNLFKFEIRHVPAHTAGITARTHVNNMCDRRAKEEMRKARADIKRLIPA